MDLGGLVFGEWRLPKGHGDGLEQPGVLFGRERERGRFVNADLPLRVSAAGNLLPSCSTTTWTPLIIDVARSRWNANAGDLEANQE